MEVEIGIPSNPIVFTGVIAGQEFLYPSNPLYLWNDKGGIDGAVDANRVTISVLELNIVDEIVGVSNSNPSQSFTVSYFPVISGDSNNPLMIKVNGVIWPVVTSLLSIGSSDAACTFDYTTGLIQFGDGIHGAIPPVGNIIEVSYTPKTTDFGAEVEEFSWVGVRSAGVISNPVIVNLERRVSTDETHVSVTHVNLLSVTGVYLNTDSHRLGINYYTGGTFNAATGGVTLGTPLPSLNTTILVDYSYTILDDFEAAFTQINEENPHTFTNPIPSNNAKQIYLRIMAPATTSPTGFLNLRFRIRLDFTA